MYMYIHIYLDRCRLSQKEISISFLEVLKFAEELPTVEESGQEFFNLKD